MQKAPQNKTPGLFDGRVTELKWLSGHGLTTKNWVDWLHTELRKNLA